MTNPTEELYKRIAEQLSQIVLPRSEQNIVDGGLVESISCHNNQLKILLRYHPPSAKVTQKEFFSFCEHVSQRLFLGFPEYNVQVIPYVAMKKTPTFVVGSGKGGVGKSSLSYALSKKLAIKGYKVFYVDADIYGPSLPTLLNEDGYTISVPFQDLEPFVSHNNMITSTSMGYYTPFDEPLIWRGPMLKKALDTILFRHNFSDCECVIVDLPPGTGDVIISLAQSLQIDGAFVVGTPDKLSFADVRRFLKMLKTLKIPLVGMIENMSRAQEFSEISEFINKEATVYSQTIPYLDHRQKLLEHMDPIVQFMATEFLIQKDLA